jgi:endoglucanase
MGAMNRKLVGCATAFAAVALAAFGLSCAKSAGTSAPGASPEAHAMAKAMGRGVNFGGVFEPPTEGAWGLKLQDEFFDKVVEAGFQNVRLPVRWSNHAALTPDATLDEVFARRLDHVIDELLKRKLIVIVNQHHYNQFDGDKVSAGEAEVDPAVVEQRFLNLWKQIAQRYRDKPAQLVFELYNEPHGSRAKRWNELAAQALALVRQSNPTRIVMIGSSPWNSPGALKFLRLPNDPNLIVTIHHYEPDEFTHQGAAWMAGSQAWLGQTCCSPAQQAKMRDPLDFAARWSAEHGYPVHIGEFGAYGKADMASRVIYTRFVREEMEKRGFSWSYWEFAAGFGIYDPTAQAWRTPLKNALLGP